MRYVAFDSETHLIKPGRLTPRMVCLTFAERAEDDGLGEPERVLDLHRRFLKPSMLEGAILEVKHDISTTTGADRGTFATGITDRALGIEWLRAILLDPNAILIGHNVWYDLGVACDSDLSLLEYVFDKLEAGLVHDTMVRQQLIDIASGEMKFHVDEDGEPKRTSYGLDALSLRLLDKRIQKKNTWRLKYALLDGVPLAEWPEEAITYAVGDAITTAQVHAKQTEIAGGEIPNSVEQHQAAWALHLMSVYGMRTDGTAVTKLHEELAHDYATGMADLRGSGLFNIKAARVLKSGPRKGTMVPEEVTKNMKAICARVEDAYKALDLPVPKTETDRVSTAKKTLVESGDGQLKALAELGAVAKLLNTFVPILESGTKVPINPRYNVLVETGRTSCQAPNCQNLPRKSGVRECFVPRAGWVFADADYDTLELRCLSQACLDLLGKSEMAEALRRDEDLHLSLGAQMLDIDYAEAKRRSDLGDEEIADRRQLAKIANFGLPGGLSPPTFVDYATQFGQVVTLEMAQAIKETWLKRWPEMVDYFNMVQLLTETGEPVIQPRSGRMRGGASYCAIANGFFQSMAADGAKNALWNVAKACYVEESSPLFGCRPVAFIHDEIIMEVPEHAFGRERTAAAANELARIMRESMIKFVPDIPIKCGPVLIRRWLKGAKAVKLDGVLVPSKYVKETADGKTLTKWVADV